MQVYSHTTLVFWWWPLEERHEVHERALVFCFIISNSVYLISGIGGWDITADDIFEGFFIVFIAIIFTSWYFLSYLLIHIDYHSYIMIFITNLLFIGINNRFIININDWWWLKFGLWLKIEFFTLDHQMNLQSLPNNW